MSPNNQFHITVAVSPVGGTLSIKNELELVKTALIYADKVNLCSVKAAMFMPVLNLSPQQQLEFLREVSGDLPLKERELLEQCIEIHKYLVNKRGHLSKEENQLKLRYKMIFDFITKRLSAESANAGFSQLFPAIKKNQLEIKFTNLKPENLDPARLTYEYLDYVNESLKSNSYLLLDVPTGSLLSMGIQLGFFDVPDTAIEKARHVKLMSNLMQRLPSFEYATVDEALDIKKELSKQLIRFRSALITYSDAIHTQPWDTNFEYDCEKTFMKEIQPCILDIEESCEANGYLKRLRAKTVDAAPIGISAAFGAFIARANNFADIFSQSSALIAGGAGVIAAKAAKEWWEEKRKIQANRLFFYYKAGKILEKR